MFDIAGQTVIPNWLKLLEGTQGSHWYPREPIGTPGIPFMKSETNLFLCFHVKLLLLP